MSSNALCNKPVGANGCNKPEGHTGEHDSTAWPWCDDEAKSSGVPFDAYEAGRLAGAAAERARIEKAVTALLAKDLDGRDAYGHGWNDALNAARSISLSPSVGEDAHVVD